jgi:protein SCO1
MGSCYLIARRSEPIPQAESLCRWHRLSACVGLILLQACSRSANLPVLGAVPEFQLTDSRNAAFDSKKVLDGRVWIANFFFTNCPGPCPRMSSQMRQVQDALEATGVGLVSMTVDPARDTPEVLAEYSKHFLAKPGVWYFLTGPQAALHHLAKDVFKLGNVDGSLDHSTRFVLLDHKGQIRGYYLTSEEDAIPRIIADARALWNELP